MKILGDAIAFGKKVVIADIHLGLLRFYDKQLIEKAVKLAERYQTVIVAGDLRHLGKRGLVEEFIERVGGICELILIKGNHDAKLDFQRSIRFGKYGIFHGHAKPTEDLLDAKFWIVGHSHPSIYINGLKERCFILGEIEDKKVIVLPAFNDLCASTAINVEEPVGFIFKKYNYKDWKAILLDGTIFSLSQFF